MKNLSLSFIFCLSFLTVQAQQMSFKSSNAATHSLVVADRSIYSANSTTVTTSPAGFSTPVSGEGTRLMWLPTKSAFRVGTTYGSEWDPINIGTWSFASGFNTIASGKMSSALGIYTQATGDYSTAMGYEAVASGDVSIASGLSTKASGAYSTAMGYSTTASGNTSTAMGLATTASGSYSTVMGYFTTAQAFGSLTIGQYNIIAGNKFSWIPTEPVFVIGNGMPGGTSSNAFTVLKNGRTAIGFEAPESMLHVKNGDSGVVSFYAPSNLNVESNTNNYISLLNPNATESGILFGNPTSSVDGGVIYNNGNSKSLQFRTNGNVTRMTLSGAGNLAVNGIVVASCGTLICSDARYKKNITSLDNSLDNQLKIRGVRYDLRQSDFPEKKFSDKNQIGFIAQDLEKTFPEMVFTDEKGYKSVDYARITPVLVEAVKEQQKQIEELKIKNGQLEASISEMKVLKAQMDSLKALLLKSDSEKAVGKR